jgi:hypothetical protein
MTFRPPEHFTPIGPERGVAQINAEVLQEKIESLGEAERRMVTRLAELKNCGEEADRDALVDAAAEAAWYFVVQRELCGIRDGQGALAPYDVPREVRLRIGAR